MATLVFQHNLNSFLLISLSSVQEYFARLLEGCLKLLIVCWLPFVLCQNDPTLHLSNPRPCFIVGLSV